MDLLAAAHGGRAPHGDLVNLVAGQPSHAGARAGARGRGDGAATRDMLGYTVALGHPRAARGDRRAPPRRYGVEVDPADVVVTTGSSGGFLLAFLAAFEAGDRVAMARPGYPSYRNILTASGCEVVEIDCGPETRFQPTVELLEALDGPVHGWWWPARPTRPDHGRARRARRDRRWCGEHGVRLVTDEIYHGITYAGRARDHCAWQTSAGHRRQLVLEVLLDDRLAARLAAGAPAAAPRGGRAGRQLRDLPAGARAVRRGRGVHARGVRRVRRTRRGVRDQPHSPRG